ncbi:MAG: hypothetical protein ABH821_05835 [archaeon]
MKQLLKNWKILLLIILLVVSIASISFNGLKYGIDFKGGTLFQIHLARDVVGVEEMSQVTTTLTQRLDWTGLKDTRVTSWGQDFVLAQIAETDPVKVQRLEELLQRQGKFESILDNNVVFTGADILSVPKDTAKGYGFRQAENGFQWQMPFILSDSAARRFAEAAFHQCSVVGFNQETGKEYTCKESYFFIDRPIESIIVMSQGQYLLEQTLPRVPELPDGAGTIQAVDLLESADLPLVTFNDIYFTEEELQELRTLSLTHGTALIQPDTHKDIKDSLIGLGFTLREVEEDSSKPWLWVVTGLKSVISLSEGITNEDSLTVNDPNFEIFYNLVITGYASTPAEAQERLQNLSILLESGSLPVPVESISVETISPFLGREFLFNALLVGLIALLVVALVIYIRYRIVKLVIPILITGLSEVILILGFASAISWSLDLAAVTGILAAVGTGVDDQIIITDELTRDKREKTSGSLLSKIKVAFFIIFAAAATTIATMFPIILFGFGLGKLVGFAITIIVGVLIGVFITRPAFSEMAKFVLRRKNDSD